MTSLEPDNFLKSWQGSSQSLQRTMWKREYANANYRDKERR